DSPAGISARQAAAAATVQCRECERRGARPAIPGRVRDSRPRNSRARRRAEPAQRGAERSAARVRAGGESMTAQSSAHRAGYVALVGRPNVGKSTLLNRLVGQKLSITSSRPQTTRYRVIGIVSEPNTQFVFVDTPGLQSRNAGRLNRALNRTASDALESVDVVVLVLEALRFGAEDRAAVGRLPRGRPVLLAINKVDAIADKTRLLPFIDLL